MQCPVCDVALSMTYREGIEIDYCQSCRGVWLDRGELDKLMDRAEPTERNDRHSHREEDLDEDDDRWRSTNRMPRGEAPPYRKRESFWSNLFDFD